MRPSEVRFTPTKLCVRFAFQSIHFRIKTRLLAPTGGGGVCIETYSKSIRHSVMQAPSQFSTVKGFPDTLRNAKPLKILARYKLQKLEVKSRIKLAKTLENCTSILEASNGTNLGEIFCKLHPLTTK